MQLSRRQFIQAALGAAAAGVLRVDVLAQQEQSVIDTLMTVVDAYVEDNGSISHYATYLNWRAEHLPRYSRLYALFAAALDRTAQDLTGTSYAETARSLRRAILLEGLELPDPQSALLDPRDPRTGAQPWSREERMWLQFDRYIVGEIVLLFTQTNAWIMLGYDGWPGQPRGLERYTQPISAGGAS
jgi:hypothetical protein